MEGKHHKHTTVKEPDLSGTYTASDYLQWKLDDLVELIRGKVVKMTPAPSSDHQKVSMELSGVLYNHFKNKDCRPFHAPFDVYLVHPGEDYKKARNIVEPDLCVICDQSKIRRIGCVGTPDLIIEILSPSTSRKDQKDKFELYEEFGVREYWLVSPENRSIIFNVLENGKFKTLQPTTSPEKLHSIIFPTLEVDLGEVFRDISTN